MNNRFTIQNRNEIMHEIVATISSKNQITLPADVRRQLGVGARDTSEGQAAAIGGFEQDVSDHDLAEFAEADFG